MGRTMERVKPKKNMYSTNERVVKRVTVTMILRRSITVKGHLALDCR